VSIVKYKKKITRLQEFFAAKGIEKGGTQEKNSSGKEMAVIYESSPLECYGGRRLKAFHCKF